MGSWASGPRSPSCWARTAPPRVPRRSPHLAPKRHAFRRPRRRQPAERMCSWRPWWYARAFRRGAALANPDGSPKAQLFLQEQWWRGRHACRDGRRHRDGRRDGRRWGRAARPRGG
eukprot:1120045-Prymnesium_polylepis.2